MVVVPLPNPVSSAHAAPGAAKTASSYWLRIAAGSSLVAGGILLLNGKHRAGLLATVTGTALAMLDQQEVVQAWWLALPSLIDDAERMLGQVDGVVQSLDQQREKLRTLVRK